MGFSSVQCAMFFNVSEIKLFKKPTLSFMKILSLWSHSLNEQKFLITISTLSILLTKRPIFSVIKREKSSNQLFNFYYCIYLLYLKISRWHIRRWGGRSPHTRKKRLRILGNQGIRVKGNEKLKLEPCTQSSRYRLSIFTKKLHRRDSLGF